MTPRLILTRVATVVLGAAAFSIALGQPPPKEPPEPGFAGEPSHDHVWPLALEGVVVTCPPPTKTSAATNPTGTNC
jgi:hypothetical protein